MAKAGVYISIIGDSKVAQAQIAAARSELDRLNRGAGVAAGGIGASMAKIRAKLSSVGASMRNVGRSMALGITLPIALAVGKVLTDLGRIETLNAQTNAAIKSTGGAANVTAKHIQAYAAGIEKKTGVEAESVQESANLLLTFKAVRNETGKGNQIFDRATKATVNMSKALGQDAKSSAIQLGKALNDPIKGVSALQRVGVSFTEAQKAQIKAMVESGDVMGAQKLILAELDSQFGGSAKAWGDTMPGQIAKAKNAFGEMAEGIVSGLLPAVRGIAEWVRDLSSRFQGLSPSAQRMVGIAVLLAAALGPVIYILGALASGLAVILSPAALVIAAMVAVAAAAVLLYIHWDRVWSWMQDHPALAVIAAILAGPFLLPIFAVVAAARFLADNWGEIWPRIQDAVASFTTWYEKNLAPVVERVAKLVGIYLAALNAYFRGWAAVAAFIWEHFGARILQAVQIAFNYIKTAIQAALLIIKGVIDVILGVLTLDWETAWSGIQSIVDGVWLAIRNLIETAWRTIALLVGTGLDALSLLWSTIWTGIKAATSSAIDAVVSFVGSLPGRILIAVAVLPGLLIGAGVALLAGLLAGATGKAGEFIGWLGELGGRIVSAVGDLGRVLFDVGMSIMQGLWDGLKEKWGSVKGWMEGLNPKNFFNDIAPRPGHADTNLVSTGEVVMAGLRRGLQREWAVTAAWLTTLNPAGALKPNAAPAASRPLIQGAGAGTTIIKNYYIDASGLISEPLTEEGLVELLEHMEDLHA